MGKLRLGLATSHAFAVTDPRLWDEMRARNRQQYANLYGTLPDEHPQVAEETDEVVAKRFAIIEGALSELRAKLDALNPDVLIIVADDQNENFTDTNLPQFAIYTGQRWVAGRLNDDGWPIDNNPRLAEAILGECVANDVDMSRIGKLPKDRLFAHAFGPVLKVLDPDAKFPTVPIFVNALHVPAPSPGRCFRVGEIVRQAVEKFDGVDRVAILASGGWSHFTSGYPWPHYDGPFGYGAISEAFDHQLLDELRQGNTRAFANLTSHDLIANGQIELRCWILAMGAIGQAKPDVLVYEPFYRAVMAMGVAAWPVN